ncbi:hypothetical protein [Anaerostipes caccae]|uniref:hypothetical protein n=1 Tax=Anaerostipes caccae TaxID=105841 RepID=UPI001F2916A7|nr:hypothetical protein [Anaerostipes caccae]
MIGGMMMQKNGFDISDEEMDARFNLAVDRAIQKAKIMGKPVAKYDEKLKKAYLEYPDGRREYGKKA